MVAATTVTATAVASADASNTPLVDDAGHNPWLRRLCNQISKLSDVEEAQKQAAVAPAAPASNDPAPKGATTLEASRLRRQRQYRKDNGASTNLATSQQTA
jgi:hypothetical protein